MAIEGVIRRFRKHQKIEKREWEQYKEAVCTLNKELTAKLTALVQETRLREEAGKAKVNLMTELAAVHDQMDKAKANAVAEFRVS